MALTKIPDASTLSDAQFIQIEGGDGVLTGYQYDKQQRILYFKESQTIYPSFHGATHIAEDPIPNATCDSPGLLSANDKCRLDALLQTRIGVLGFQGAGFPDDGGWMMGDVILAAGTEFISLERIGNVVRFTVDSPVLMNCSPEAATQIFWVQDESEAYAVRPPVVNGKIPGLNGYGELKIYAYPESTIFTTGNTATKLLEKGNYPSLIFKRYDDQVSPGRAELDIVLKRDFNNLTTSEIGWSFTPGPNDVPECVWFVGKDSSGSQLSFKLSQESEPGLLGSLLYNGHLISKRMAVITGYNSTIVSNNQYKCRWWDVDGIEPLGNPNDTETYFTATNVWHYSNPESTIAGARTLSVDSSIDLLPVGTLVDIWFFQVGTVSTVPIRRYYFNQRPHLNPNHLWSSIGAIAFGDLAIVKDEKAPDVTNIDAASTASAIRDIEKSIWGVDGFQDPLILFDDVAADGTGEATVNNQHRAIIDPSLPALKVMADTEATGTYSERPVYLWNKNSLYNSMIRMDIGAPSNQGYYPPYDILLGAQIDSYESTYMRVDGIDQLNGTNYIQVSGIHFKDLPTFGTIRILAPSARKNLLYNYSKKFMYPSGDSTKVILVAEEMDNLPFPGAVGDIVELLRQEYNNPCVRIEFGMDGDEVQMQVKVGILDMSVGYNPDQNNDAEDYVRGFSPGYTVSSVYTQAEVWDGSGTKPATNPDAFYAYSGGTVTEGEKWNRLEIMQRDAQIWVWWNGLLIPPNTILSAALPTPVNVSTPYFPITMPRPFGKIGARLWSGATVRNMQIETQSRNYSEYSRGQLEIS